MGNSNTVIDFEYKIAANDYKPLQKVKDARLGELVQMKNAKSGHIVLMKEKKFDDSEIYNQKIEECVNHLCLKHQNLAKVYGFAGADAHEMFNNKYKIYIYFESLQDSLQRAINVRKPPLDLKGNNASRKPLQLFSEIELLSILYQLVDVLNYLQENGVTHGEIKPESCFLTPEGTIKVLNQQLICDGPSPYELVRQGNRRIFLTPIALEALKRRKGEPIEDKYKADVFRLGLTLLECATLKSSTQVYDWNNYSINRNIIASRLTEVSEQQYSKRFCDILEDMLALQEEQRPDFKALKRYLGDMGRMSIVGISCQPAVEGKGLGREFEVNKMEKTQSSNDLGIQNVSELTLNRQIASCKSSSTSTNGKIFGKEENVKGEEKNVERMGRFGRRYQDEENVDDDVAPSEGNVKINKVFQRVRPVHRSVDKFRTATGSTTEVHDKKPRREAFGSGSHAEYLLKAPPVPIKRGEQNVAAATAAAANGKDRDSMGKFRGNSTYISRAREEKEVEEDFHRRIETEVIRSSNTIFPLKPKSLSTQIQLENNPTGRSLQIGHSDQYNYANCQEYKRQFSVEKLVQEAVKRSEKHHNSVNESLDAQIHFNTEPDFPNESLDKGFGRPAPNQALKTKAHPLSLSQLQISNSYGLPINLSNGPIKPQFAKNTAQTPSNVMMINANIGKRSPSDVSFMANTPSTVFQSPPYSSQTSLPVSTSGSFAGTEMLRPSLRPQVVDLIDEMNETNKALIDSIVKPAFLSTKYEEQKHFFPRKAFTPTMNMEVKAVQRPTRGANYTENMRKQGEEKGFPVTVKHEEEYVSKQVMAKGIENRGPADLAGKGYAKMSTYKDGNNMGKQVTQQRDMRGVLETSKKINIPIDKRNGNEAFEDQIKKAIERSRKTYEFAKNIVVNISESDTPGPKTSSIR